MPRKFWSQAGNRRSQLVTTRPRTSDTTRLPFIVGLTWQFLQEHISAILENPRSSRRLDKFATRSRYLRVVCRELPALRLPIE